MSKSDVLPALEFDPGVEHGLVSFKRSGQMPYEYQDQQNLSIIAMTTKAQTVTIENYCILLQTLPSLYTFTYQYNVFSRISSIQSAGQRHNDLVMVTKTFSDGYEWWSSCYWLVVMTYLWKIWVNWDDDIPIFFGKIKVMFQSPPTSGTICSLWVYKEKQEQAAP